jgi:DNA-binding transcriptional MocR family regulator
MLLFTLDATSPVPRYRQIVERIREMADADRVEAGTRLPPTRVLAERLGVNRATVLRAYEELWALGYLEARPGSYSTLRQRVRVATAGERMPDALDWKELATPAAAQVHEAYRRFAALTGEPPSPGVINFGTLAGDRALAPVDELRRVVARLLREEPGVVVEYGAAQGHAGLREAIAVRLRAHDIAIGADEVMITNGAQHAIELVAKLLVAPGWPVVVERPTYSAAVPLLRFAGARLVEVPMRDDGMDLDALAARLGRVRPAFVYTMPTFHNPTGITTSQAHRERLLEICHGKRIPLVEDSFEEELKYFGRAVLPIKSMDRDGVVIYLGTLSKLVFPGLRVGWVAAPRKCIERLVALNRFASLSTTTLGQAALARFLTEGRFEAHVRRVHATYRKRMTVLLRRLRETMPEGVSWTEPQGGYTLWLRVPGSPAHEPALLEALAAVKVAVAPGSIFFASDPTELGLRLSISNLDEGAIAEGVARLARALRRVVGR